MTMSETQSRTTEEYQADKAYGPGEWKDWAKLEGKAVVDAAMVKYIGEHPEIAQGDEDFLDRKREEIAMEEARKSGLDVDSPAPDAPKWGEGKETPAQAA